MDHRYAAGFFDADGHLGIDRKTLAVYVTQARTDVLEAFLEKYGGKIRVERPGAIALERVNGVHRQICRWNVVGWPAITFLREVLPYLIVKKARVELVLARWEDHVNGRVRKRMPNSYYQERKALGHKVALFAMTRQEIQEEQEFRANWLKERGWD